MGGVGERKKKGRAGRRLKGEGRAEEGKSREEIERGRKGRRCTCIVKKEIEEGI